MVIIIVIFTTIFSHYIWRCKDAGISVQAFGNVNDFVWVDISRASEGFQSVDI